MHRRLKDALHASAEQFSWVSRLPMVMLSIRCAMRDDGQLAPSEMVHGSSLTLPADLLVPSSENIVHNEADYSHRLRKYMQEQRQIQTTHNVRANPHLC